MAKNDNRNNKEKNKKKEKDSAFARDLFREVSTAEGKRNKNKGSRFGQRLEEFFKEYKGCKKNGFPLADCLMDFTEDIAMWVITQGRQDNDRQNKLFNILSKKDVAKAFKSLYKSDEEAVPLTFLRVLEVMFQIAKSNNSDFSIDNDVVEIYVDLINRMTKGPAKKINKKIDFGMSNAQDFFMLIPTKDLIRLKIDKQNDSVSLDSYLVNLYSKRIISKLVNKATAKDEGVLNLDPNKIQKLFKVLMSEYTMPYVVVQILLLQEGQVRNCPKEFLNNLYSMALNFFNNVDKETGKNILAMYKEEREEHRKKNNIQHDPRVLKLNGPTIEKYENISKWVAKDIEKNGDKARGLLS